MRRNGYYEHNSGSLFIHDKAKKNSPDYSGYVDIDGVKYWLNGWLKEGNAGRNQWMALRVTKSPTEEERREGIAASMNGTATLKEQSTPPPMTAAESVRALFFDDDEEEENPF